MPSPYRQEDPVSINYLLEEKLLKIFTSGTDHGTAAPHFLVGGNVNGGLYSHHPDLGKLVDGDMSYTMDYRTIYELILGKWFSIIGNKFKSYKSDFLHEKVIKST